MKIRNNILTFTMIASSLCFGGPQLKATEDLPNTQVFSIGGAATLNLSAEKTSDYTARDFSDLKGQLSGFSDKALDTHFKLYAGYVKNTNKLLNTLDQLRADGEMISPHYAELKRRFGWEFNGMRLHEYYFENLGNGALETDSMLSKMLTRDFGGFSEWEADFRATGKMRGIGWVILYQDPRTGRLVNDWVNDHHMGHLSGGVPLLVMDVWEHAYMVDYDINRGEYISSFLKNIDWNVVSARLVE